MIDLQLIDETLGFPIYFQNLPVKSVSVYWLVFVGSADDESVGQHGIYHWFEHIPSRGTQKYPGGYRDTEARLVRHGGSAGAETDYSHTAYYADIPRRVWPMALDILTDMIAQPLLRPEDIEAEREIIQQEIDEWHSSPHGESLCVLPSLLWPGHPLGHDQLGSRESLQAMSPELLRQAHREGYTRSRSVLFVAGDLQPREVIETVAEAASNFAPGAEPCRRRPAAYGRLPAWQSGKRTVYDTRHEDSAVYLLFPVPPVAEVNDAHILWTMAEYFITAGDLGSPLNRIVREDSQLAYSPGFISSISTDGGYWGLEAQTNAHQPQLVIDRFWEVLRSDELRSSEWFDFVTDTIRGEFDMHDPSPSDFTEEAAERLTGYGELWSDDELRRRLLSVSREMMAAFFDELAEGSAHSLIFRGKGAR